MERESNVEEPDPHDELQRLARGVAGHVKRRRRLGGVLASEVGAAAGSAPTAPPVRAPERAAAQTQTPAAKSLPTAVRGPATSPIPTPTSSSIQSPTPAPAPSRAPSRTAPATAPADSNVLSNATVAAGPARSAADVRAQAAAAKDLEEVRRGVAQCQACTLCQTRTNTVFLDGKGASGLMFVGEAPGADEDRTGVPFVGRAGKLLTDIVTKGMGLDRQDVWIANVLKCRPPENRDPTPEEKATCTPWLDRQIEILAPKILVPLGRHASMHVLGGESAMGAMRGRVHTVAGRPVVPTFHPAYLLRNASMKKECWQDIQLAMRTIGLQVPTRDSSTESSS